MAIKVGLIIWAIVGILSGIAMAYFAGIILLWTFGLASSPVEALIRLFIWAVPLLLSWFCLEYLSQKEAAQ